MNELRVDRRYGVVAILPGMRLLGTLLAFCYLVTIASLAYWQGSTSMPILAGLAAMVMATVWPLLAGRPDWGWFHPIVFCPLRAFLTRQLPLSGVFVLGMNHHNALPTWSPDDLNSLVATELWLTALGLICYYAGHLSGLGPPRPRLNAKPPRFLVPVLVSFVVLSSSLFLWFLSTRGGLLFHLAAWADVGRQQALGGWGALVRLTRFGSFAVLIWLAFDRKALRNPVFWIAAVVSLAINFLGTGSRSSVLVMLIAAVAVVSMRTGKLRWRTAFVVALASLVLLGLLGAVRRSGSADELEEGSRSTGEWLEAAIVEMATRESVTSSSYPILALVPEQLDLLCGRTYLVAVTGFIPRAVWPDRPRTAGRMAGEQLFSIQGGRPPGAIGEAYWNLHIPGIVFVHFLFGVFHRWVALTVRENPQAPVGLVLLTLTLTLPTPTGTALLEWLYSTATIGVIAWCIGLFRRSS